ncbi:MAG TPA: hypothetical protein VMV33_04445 [Rhodocyclaceae bacterium]|nr:hypothetical protein [Rhodocyclaceae bacterium]
MRLIEARMIWDRSPHKAFTSYAGLSLHAGLLWVSYYSSHEGKPAIYFAKVAIDG